MNQKTRRRHRARFHWDGRSDSFSLEEIISTNWNVYIQWSDFLYGGFSSGMFRKDIDEAVVFGEYYIDDCLITE